MDEKPKYWIELADYDLETAEALLESKRYLYVGFMCHQAVEKALKACYTNNIDAQPPRTHNLRLLAQKSNVMQDLSEEQAKFLVSLEPFNIEARYPTDKDKMFKSATEERCKRILESSTELLKWIKSKL